LDSSAAVESSARDILFDRRGTAGIVTLNRPEALNALTHAMVRALAEKLAQWQDDPAVGRVIITGAGDRAFCAGGDLRALYELHRAGRDDEALTFWRDEYRLNALIKRYRKPYIALVDGVMMGGGVGVAVHGSHRVAGDRFRFAMPEVGIGFFPDVGATWFLPRMPGEAGTWCALTGGQLDADDATGLGIATHRLRSARLRDLLEGLCGASPVDALLTTFAEQGRDGPVSARRGVIDHVFAPERVEDIVAALDRAAGEQGEDAELARSAAAAIRTKSPLSLKLARAQIRLGKGLDFEDCLRTEFRIVSRVVTGHDFYEGIRAVIIDKDHQPRWQPPSLEAVSEAEVARHFAPVAAEPHLP
jgi:enoyl-CoA hydratase